MQDRQYNGVVLEDKWGKTYLCSTCLLAYADLDAACVKDVNNAEFGRYFLHGLEPQWNLRQIWVEMYQHATPWACDLSTFSDFQLRDALLQLFAADNMRVWQLTDGWGHPPEDNGIGEGGLSASSNQSATAPAKTSKAAKPGGGVVADAPVAAKAAVHEMKTPAESIQNTSPKSLAECTQLLTLSRKRLMASGTYIPKYNSDELSAMAASGVVANERFIVSLQKVKSEPDAPIGYARPSSRTTAWTTTFDLAENSDSDPELLCDLNGMIYDPNTDYELVIIDQGEYYQQNGAVNFIPTYQRLAELGKTEFAGEYSHAEIEEVLTPAYSTHYKSVMNEYSALGGKPWEEAKLDRFLEEKYAGDTVAERKFKVRNAFNTEIGANEHFSGDGVTKTTGASRYNLEPGQNGNLEMILFERNPKSARALESSNAIVKIPAKSILTRG
jgi:hypothetical protein